MWTDCFSNHKREGPDRVYRKQDEFKFNSFLLTILHKSKRDDALVLAKELRDRLLDEGQHLSTLILGCKTVRTYLGTMEENR